MRRLITLLTYALSYKGHSVGRLFQMDFYGLDGLSASKLMLLERTSTELTACGYFCLWHELSFKERLTQE